MGFLAVCIALVPFVILLGAIMSRTSSVPWGKRLAGATTPAALPYRASVVVRWRDAKEPRIVRVTSALTAFFGGMVFPGGIVGLIWMLAAVVVAITGRAAGSDWFIMALGASVPTGILIGWRCLTLYTPMIENRAGLSEEMRTLSRWIVAQNLFVTGTWIGGAIATGELGILVLCAYTAIKFVHAWLLRRCANVIDRENEASETCERQLAAGDQRPQLATQDEPSSARG